MADVHSPAVRSKNMRAIRGRDTKPEIWLRKCLHKLGFRYRIAPPNLPAKPDIYLPKYNAAVLVNGCFWHSHGCYLFKLPSSRKKFWQDKLSGNVERDKRNLQFLLDKNYRVLIVWECALKGKDRLQPDKLLTNIQEWLVAGDQVAVADTEGFTDVRETKRYFCRCCGKIPYSC
ncbi:very short patch repair endonuclease [Lacimicrobium alkaliphilum]|uniref:very short patch repair endonuclease n=1 Tax=Lacimicrobium alkaliphilum TaxID=1526571 RepID=UPI0009E74D09|nr:DNA mismatch endonuclease Vsr [Lacimicrobium alkaliphilum]